MSNYICGRCFKTPSEVIQNFYEEKYISSIAATHKPTTLLQLARGNQKHYLAYLYFREHLLNLALEN